MKKFGSNLIAKFPYPYPAAANTPSKISSKQWKR